MQKGLTASCAGISTVTQNANWSGSQTQLNQLNESRGRTHKCTKEQTYTQLAGSLSRSKSIGIR